MRLCGTVDTPASGKLIYGLLLENAGTNGVHISVRQMGRTLGISPGTVRANIRRLKEAGYISAFPQYHSDGGRAANLYQIR
jgi:DNA-binding Lrp family transcriptional regulator